MSGRSTSTTPQALAVRALRAAQRPGAFSNRVLGELLERHDELEPGARGLVTALVYGVLRHRARLDAHIDAHARDPGKLGAVPRELLRVAAYEVIELQRPLGNAVEHAIAAAREFDPSGRLGKLAHGILAAVAQDFTARDEAALAAPLRALELRWSVPRWLGGRWLKQLGPERALQRARVLADPPPVDLRIDLGRISADEAATRLAEERPDATLERVPDQPQALRVRGGGDLFYGLLHDEGLVSVQGLAAQQPAIVLAPQPDERVLDACAGLGVKTLQLAELMDRSGTIVAVDREPRQLAEHERLRARGRMDAASIVGDLAEPLPELDALAPFDAVLLDVPCTGLGNLARHPEIRWQRRFEDIAAAAALQSRLLARALVYLRPGGRLVYAVCSAEPEEGPAIVEAALAAGGISCTHARLWTPEHDATEGFYVARLERA
ncbi:MAG TPA: transcription antitermination factor NusB [Nannocystaceae bacterium]|nr:transcription antitermination factor NusB [Nannocystaceae bacterium]